MLLGLNFSGEAAHFSLLQQQPTQPGGETGSPHSERDAATLAFTPQTSRLLRNQPALTFAYFVLY